MTATALTADRLATVGLLLGAFFLRLWQLGAKELWFDETASTFVAAKPWLEIIRYSATATSEHPPFFYLLLHGWSQLTGESEWAMRFLAAGFGTLFVAALAGLGRRLGGRSLSLSVLAVAAIAPFAVFYAQELRMYSLLMLLSTLFIWNVVDLLAGRDRAVVPLVLLSVVGLATSYFFAPLLLAADLLFFWKRPPLVRRHWRWYLLAHGLGIAAGTGVLLLPGPRETMRQLITSGSDLGTIPPALQELVGRTAGIDPPLFSALVLWALTLAGLVRWQQQARPTLWPFAAAPFLLILLLPVMSGRYLSSGIPVVYLFLAQGAVWISDRWPRATWLLYPSLLIASLAPLPAHYQSDKGYFGAALETAVAATRGPEDVLILAEPDAWPQLDFYSRPLDMLPTIRYIPEDRRIAAVDAAMVNQALDPLLDEPRRLVLGPFSPHNRDPDSLLERTLLERAFAVERRFWPDSTLVAVFVGPRPLFPGPSALDFGGRIRLRESRISNPQPPPGGEIAVELQLEALETLPSQGALSLQLQDELGVVWALQQSAPCNGWCPTESWRPGVPVTDRRALLVPADLPPGAYTLILRADGPDGPIGVPQPLASVTVSGAAATTRAETGTGVDLGVVELLQLAILPGQLQAGGQLRWEARWRRPAGATGEWQLLWTLRRDGQEIERWLTPPTRPDYPPSLWAPEQPVRGRGNLTLPATLPAGDYRLDVAAVNPAGEPLGAAQEAGLLSVTGREHRFDLPDVGRPVEAEWAEGVTLRRVVLPLSGDPGAVVPVTLVWQAGGATGRPYKFFLQLRDMDNRVVAQDDQVPGQGTAPTLSWVPDEVIVGEHQLRLPAELEAGQYALFVGLYHEASGERLPLLDGGDELYLETVSVEGP